jgi:hypothetical protein
VAVGLRGSSDYVDQLLVLHKALRDQPTRSGQLTADSVKRLILAWGAGWLRADRGGADIERVQRVVDQTALDPSVLALFHRQPAPQADAVAGAEEEDLLVEPPRDELEAAANELWRSHGRHSLRRALSDHYFEHRSTGELIERQDRLVAAYRLMSSDAFRRVSISGVCEFLRRGGAVEIATAQRSGRLISDLMPYEVRRRFWSPTTGHFGVGQIYTFFYPSARLAEDVPWIPEPNLWFLFTFDEVSQWLAPFDDGEPPGVD